MKSILLCLGCVCFLSFVSPARPDDKPKGVIVVDVAPDELAKDFQKDAKAAEKKYSPDGPLGGAGGTLINIHGPVEVKEKSVFLKNSTELKIELDAAPLPEKVGDWAAVLKPIRFVKFTDKTIHLEGKGLKYQRIIGKPAAA